MTTSTIDRGAEWKRRLSFSNISVIYILIALVVFFGVWKTDLFLTYDTFTGMLNQNAIQALMALSLIMALSCGVFDLSIGYVMSLNSMLTAWLVSPQYGNLTPVSAVIVIAILVSLLAGAVNGVIVVVFKIDSFIGTLATGSIFYACAVYITDNVPISVGTSTIRSLGSWSVARLEPSRLRRRGRDARALVRHGPHADRSCHLRDRSGRGGGETRGHPYQADPVPVPRRLRRNRRNGGRAGPPPSSARVRQPSATPT